MKKAFRYILILSVSLLLIILSIWYLGIPDRYVSERLESLAPEPYVIKVNGLKKGLFFDFGIDSLTVSDGSNDMLSVSDVKGRLNPLKMVSGIAAINIQGQLYGGWFSGSALVMESGEKVDATFGDIDIGMIDYVSSLGFDGKGELSGSFSYDKGNGELEFIINDVDMKGYSGGGVYVPLKYFHTVRGAAGLSPPYRMVVRSISLTGDDIYVRARGNISNGLADLELEIMPEDTFSDSSLLVLIDRYKVSDGYYFIPLKRKL
ncbi:MAG: type II secretion system protein GspN [Nitrospirota bacterium]|nr:MAG: type II secretion system protein GspN [Nitrospirota bacterium]